jgi:hypothetical protein
MLKIYFASLRLCVKLGSQIPIIIGSRDAKNRKDKVCKKHATTNLFCEMVLVTDSHIILKQHLDMIPLGKGVKHIALPSRSFS